jgi:hypothetical protein
MAKNIISSLGEIILPKGKGQKDGRGAAPEFVRGRPEISAPTYREHLQDIYVQRTANDNRALLATYANFDPDISAAIAAYLSMAGMVEPVVWAYGPTNEVDVQGITLGHQLLAVMTTTNDYTIGFSNKPSIDKLCTDHRYMMLLRGSSACELVLDKTYIPTELRTVDPATLKWEQTASGVFRPIQTPTGSNEEIDLNIPTFFTSTYNQSPLQMYTFSPFVSSIATIAARSLVINELYRIMKIVGYPRMTVSVLEDVIRKNAAPSLRNQPDQMREYIARELNTIQTALGSLGSGEPFVHTDSVKPEIINDKNPGAGIQIQNVIDVLNAQNQAALKVMPSVVGKGNNGQVASTEARLFALQADALNRAVATLLSKALTLAARLSGYPGRIVVKFPPVELRPAVELEPQLTMKQSRLSTELSRGTISDEEYAMAMFGRPPLASAPKLSGTNFDAKPMSFDTEGISPNSDSLGRSQTGDGGTAVARDNNAK